MNYHKIAQAFTLLNERKWSKVPGSPVVRRTDAKRGRIANRIERNKYSRSMLVAQHPKGLSPVPRFADERTKTLFSAYARRKAVKADRQ